METVTHMRLGERVTLAGKENQRPSTLRISAFLALTLSGALA